MHSGLLDEITGFSGRTTHILSHPLRKNKIAERRLLIIKFGAALSQVLLGVGNTAIKGIKVMAYCTVFTLGPVARRITIRGQVIIGRDHPGDPPP